jgi:hypothetical protein
VGDGLWGNEDGSHHSMLLCQRKTTAKTKAVGGF